MDILFFGFSKDNRVVGAGLNSSRRIKLVVNKSLDLSCYLDAYVVDASKKMTAN